MKDDLLGGVYSPTGLEARGIIAPIPVVEDTWTAEDEAAWQRLQARRTELHTQYRNRIVNMWHDKPGGYTTIDDWMIDWMIDRARELTEALKPFVK